MEKSLVIPAAVIGVVFIVSGAIIGVAYLSGSPGFLPRAPANLAPFDSPTPYGVGDLIQSKDGSQVVIVTGYDVSRDLYSFQKVTLNFSTRDVHIMEGTGTMRCEEFEGLYPHKILMNP